MVKKKPATPKIPAKGNHKSTGSKEGWPKHKKPGTVEKPPKKPRRDDLGKD